MNEKGLLLRIRDQNLFVRLSEKLRDLRDMITGNRPRVVDQDRVLIPQECMLDLWQSIRGYGFCTPRVMPQGLDVLAIYLMPILEKLSYMTPVELSRRRQDSREITEPGLQLYAPPATEPDRLPILAQRA
jgi:hypothetical protein